MLTYYLAHPYPSRHRMRRWQNYIEDLLPDSVNILNPFYDTGRLLIREVDKGKLTDEQYKDAIDPQEIVDGDIKHLVKADGVIAILNHDIPCGTLMEIVYAYQAGVPVIVVAEDPGYKNHPWIQYHATMIFDSLYALQLRLEEGD